jgi:plasmid maintenance system antidote protein VapI
MSDSSLRRAEAESVCRMLMEQLANSASTDVVAAWHGVEPKEIRRIVTAARRAAERDLTAKLACQLANVTEYAEKYADLSETPKNGQCRKDVRKANATLTRLCAP